MAKAIIKKLLEIPLKDTASIQNSFFECFTEFRAYDYGKSNSENFENMRLYRRALLNGACSGPLQGFQNRGCQIFFYPYQQGMSGICLTPLFHPDP